MRNHRWHRITHNPRLLEVGGFFSDLVIIPLLILVSWISRVRRIAQPHLDNPRVVFGSTPLINNLYWSRSLRQSGYKSDCYMLNVYSIMNSDEFDHILTRRYRWCPLPFRLYLGFAETLLKYDIVVTSCDGMFAFSPLLRRSQSLLLRQAGIHVVVFPYGSDSYVYSQVKSSALLHGLLSSYPRAARTQNRITSRVKYWVRNADVFIPGFMGPDGFGRWDVLLPSPFMIDLSSWTESRRNSRGDARSSCVRIGHAPNHRGFKGTEFLVAAVQQLKQEGLNIELVIMEGLKNSEVKRMMTEDIDILVEQLVFTGYAMNGIEGMASGVPVVSNLEDDQYLLPARRWSFLGECPIVSATPENIVDVLRELAVRPELRVELGQMGRQYVEKYHGLDSALYMFSTIFDYLFGRRESLVNLYHPLSSEHVNRSPRIIPPLHSNRLRSHRSKID